MSPVFSCLPTAGLRAGSGGGQSGTGLGFKGAWGPKGKKKLSVVFSTLSFGTTTGFGGGPWTGLLAQRVARLKPAALLPSARGVPAEHLLNYRHADP